MLYVFDMHVSESARRFDASVKLEYSLFASTNHVYSVDADRSVIDVLCPDANGEELYLNA